MIRFSFRAVAVLILAVLSGTAASRSWAHKQDAAYKQLTLENELPLPVDIYYVHPDGKEELWESIITKAQQKSGDKSVKITGLPSKKLETETGNRWRIKARRSLTAAKDNALPLYDYLTTEAPQQTHRINKDEYFLRRLTPGVTVVLLGDTGVLTADDNPVARFGAAVQGEPRVQVRSIVTKTENHNYRWIVRAANNSKPQAISLLLDEYRATYLAYDAAAKSWFCAEPPVNPEAAAGSPELAAYQKGLADFNESTSFNVRLDPAVVPTGTPIFLTRSDAAANTPADKSQRFLAIPWGESAELGKLETLRLIGIVFDSSNWRTIEQKGVGQPTQAEIDQAGKEGTFGIQAIESVDYCQYGYHAIRMDPYNFQRNGLAAGRTKPIFDKGSSGTAGLFYNTYGYRVPTYLWLQPEKGFRAVEESQMFSSQQEFQETTASTYSDIKNTSLSASATVGTGGLSPVSASVTVGASTNLTFGSGTTLTNAITKNSSTGSTSLMRTKHAHEFWLILNKRNVKLHETFREAVLQLLEPDEPGQRPRAELFFESFGTHYPVASLFGARAVEISSISTSELVNNSRKAGGTNDEDGYVKKTTDNEKVFGKGSKVERSNKVTLGVGGAGTNFEGFDKGQVKDYIPIKVYMRPITDLILAELLTENSTQADVVLYNSLQVALNGKLADYLNNQAAALRTEAAKSLRPECFSITLDNISSAQSQPPLVGKSQNIYSIEGLLVDDNYTNIKDPNGRDMHPGYENKAILKRGFLLDEETLEFNNKFTASLANAKPFVVTVNSVSPNAPQRMAVRITSKTNTPDPKYPNFHMVYGMFSPGYYVSRPLTKYANKPAVPYWNAKTIYGDTNPGAYIDGKGTTFGARIFQNTVISAASDRLNVFTTGRTAEGEVALCASGVEKLGTNSFRGFAESFWYDFTVSRVLLVSEAEGDGLPSLDWLEPQETR